MIKGYLVFLAVVFGLMWNNIYAAPKDLPTSAQLPGAGQTKKQGQGLRPNQERHTT